MWSLEYLDDSTKIEYRKRFVRLYSEFKSIVIGASQDRTCAIIECYMPDGKFYFRVDDKSVSQAHDRFESNEIADLLSR